MVILVHLFFCPEPVLGRIMSKGVFMLSEGCVVHAALLVLGMLGQMLATAAVAAAAFEAHPTRPPNIVYIL